MEFHAIRNVATKSASAPGGHYVQARSYGGLLHVSGQLPIGADGNGDPNAAFEQQAQIAMMNVLAIVEAGGSSPNHILQVTVYIVGITNWPTFNNVYARLMGEARPARSVVPVPELHYGYQVEIDAIAAIFDRDGD
jgi:reactive intermediate/imine deaminase